MVSKTMKFQNFKATDPSEVRCSKFLSTEIGVFKPKIWTKSCFSPILTIFTPPHDIHGWKATDLSVVLAPSDRNLKHPTSRQNFGDAPGQTPKLILTLCHTIHWVSRFQNKERPWRHSALKIGQ